MDFKKTSPYYDTPTFGSYLGNFVERTIPKNDETDSFITIERKYHRKPGLLAKDLFGSAELGWVFAQVNRNLMKDPIYDLVEGLQIRVPSKERLFSLLK